MIDMLVHLVTLLVMPPLLLGLITRIKALFAGRRGPPVLQFYYDLVRLMRKDLVISTTTTWIFRIAPAATLAAVLLAGLLIPCGNHDAPISFAGDLILFAYLAALARFFTTVAALDTGSPFEGMGAAREVTFACLSEPALFLALLALARMSGSLNLTSMMHATSDEAWTASAAPLVLVGAAIFIVLLAESCRIPVDDPSTHLELTMIHEVMVLDHSGPLLGLVIYSAAMKLFVFGALLLQVLVPWQPDSGLAGWALFVAEMLALAAVIGVIESTMARLQIRHVPHLLIAAGLLAGVAFLLVT